MFQLMKKQCCFFFSIPEFIYILQTISSHKFHIQMLIQLYSCIYLCRCRKTLYRTVCRLYLLLESNHHVPIKSFIKMSLYVADVDIGAVRLSEQDDIVDYLWNIDNKYYTSQVLVRTIEKLSVKLSMEETVAFIVYHDPQTVRYEFTH